MEGNEGSTVNPLTEAQRARIERNREKARSLRRACHPYERASGHSSSVAVPAKSKEVEDTHAGFILEEEEATSRAPSYKLAEESVPALPDKLQVCGECRKQFAESYLWCNFDLSVCDACRDPNGRHSFITKTEAKQRFLLKDCDFEERCGPPLKFLLKKNPHSYGDMKLYLQCQVETRALQIWGGSEGLEEGHRKRTELQEKRREKKYVKSIKELRRAVNIAGLQSPRIHEHVYPEGQDEFDSITDLWTKTCSVCGHQVAFEKL